jgi:hypothetical protein
MGFEQAIRAGSIPILIRALRKALGFPLTGAMERARAWSLRRAMFPIGSVAALATALRSKFPNGNIEEGNVHQAL